VPATTIVVTRTVPALPSSVFDAWTDVERLASWWWPQLAGTTYAVDARPGGVYRIHAPAIGATVSGVFTDVDPPRRLAFTWNWQDDEEPGAPVEDTVAVTFEPRADATLLNVAHASEQHAPDDGTEQGWNDVLARLVELYVRGPEDQSTSSRS
jgi:uncharacterized protein YndB with AHSA1/START domain